MLSCGKQSPASQSFCCGFPTCLVPREAGERGGQGQIYVLRMARDPVLPPPPSCTFLHLLEPQFSLKEITAYHPSALRFEGSKMLSMVPGVY
jgi:hypothetical protein